MKPLSKQVYKSVAVILVEVKPKLNEETFSSFIPFSPVSELSTILVHLQYPHLLLGLEGESAAEQVRITDVLF